MLTDIMETLDCQRSDFSHFSYFSGRGKNVKIYPPFSADDLGSQISGKLCAVSSSLTFLTFYWCGSIAVRFVVNKIFGFQSLVQILATSKPYLNMRIEVIILQAS